MSLTIDNTTIPIYRIMHAVERAFQLADDGWYYPTEPGEPLVRIAIQGREYRIERRRKVTLAWLPIVEASIAEFNEDAFEMWRSHWQMTLPAC